MQGFLKDGSGKAIADGTQSITFKIYNNIAGTPPALWEETQNVTVSGGIYSVQLGSVTSIENLGWNEPYFVGVTIQGAQLTPLTELTYAPYAFGVNKATKADTATYVKCSGAVGDVKYSILNPTQFAAQWKLLSDGWKSIAGSIGNYYGFATVTNPRFVFRGQEFEGQADNHDPGRTFTSPIAILQDQAMQTHTHPLGTGSTNSTGSHSHEIALNLSNGSAAQNISGLGGFYPSGNASRNTSTPMIAASDRAEGTTHQFDIGGVGNHQHSLTGNTDNNNGFSAVETRPKNLNLWTYIRVN